MQVLYTRRLVLRPFADSDAAELAALAGAREIAATTLRIPHPYTLTDAQQFIAGTRTSAERGTTAVFAVTLQSGELCGACGLEIDASHEHAEIGYWIGVPFWGQGFATEAARAVLDYGFAHLNLHRVFAFHLHSNAASGRVLQKIGMRYEGRLRDHIFKWGKFYDGEAYGILATDARDDAASS